MNYINTYFNALIHLLYPRLCAGCGSDLVRTDQLICFECVRDMPITHFFRHRMNPVEKLFQGRIDLVSAAAYVYFTKQSVIRNLLHELKYKGNKEVGIYFGKLMGYECRKTEIFNDVDALIPLPLFSRKEKKRGYNQAEVICNGLSEAMNIPVWNDVLTRNAHTETQTRKSRMKRWDNIEGKFTLLNKRDITNKHLMLVDDVITTGATLEASGMELLKGCNTRLSIATLAYTSL